MMADPMRNEQGEYVGDDKVLAQAMILIADVVDGMLQQLVYIFGPGPTEAYREKLRVARTACEQVDEQRGKSAEDTDEEVS